jgi:hypothetical protein
MLVSFFLGHNRYLLERVRQQKYDRMQRNWGGGRMTSKDVGMTASPIPLRAIAISALLKLVAMSEILKRL